MATVFNTNKDVAVVKATEALCQWLSRNDLGMLITKAKATNGYFLVDSPYADLANTPRPLEERQKHMLSWFKRVFESELATLGVPENLWPDTASFELFQQLFAVDFHLLEADLGVLPLKTKQVSM